MTELGKSNLQGLVVGLFLSITIGIWLTPSQVQAFGECSEYGLMTTYNYLTRSCSCMTGYVWGTDFLGNPSCVSGSSACYDKYGYNSRYDYLSNSCECAYGYTFSTQYGRTQCVSLDSLCRDQLGFGASYDILSDQCKCGYGDIINNGTCTNGDLVCHLDHGFNSDYDTLSNSCECDSGYTFDEDYQCVKKQNNVYFTLFEVDTDERKAIIRSDYDFGYYQIEYGLGCYSFSFSRYVNQKIVVNLGTDFNLDMWDKIVLQDDAEVCNITDVERVSSDTTLDTDEDTVTYFYYSPPADTPTPTVFPGLYDSAKRDEKLIERLKGAILLQTESHGEAWYVNPTDSLRYYMKDGQTAYNMMRSFGLGITDKDLAQIPSAQNVEAVKTATNACLKNRLADQLKGKILIQVEQHGEAWYIHSTTCTRVYMKDGAAAYSIMRELGLGITNNDLTKLPSGTGF